MQQEFQVHRQDLPTHRIVDAPLEELAAGQIRATVDRFAFTANNMTYAVAGDMLGYWQFFPPVGGDATWGVIPVWAHADVTESRADGIAAGDRLYGYFPPATSVVMEPTQVTDDAFIDGVAHRQALPPLYNRYRRVGPSTDGDADDAAILLGPLHMTSFCLGERLVSRGFHDADQVVVVSASSKTSLGLAYALRQMDARPEVIGLTSASNLGFVSEVDLYDQVVAYDDVAELAQRRTVVVDMAGNPNVAAALSERLGEQLAFTINVGITHWDDARTAMAGGTVQQGESEMFFAPSFILELMKEWGPGEYDRRAGQFTRAAAEATSTWMTVETKQGLSGLADVYADVCAGELSPAIGLIIQM